MAKGLAVTWDNPDIQITTPSGVAVPSSDLSADTDYIVVATIHNASFDPALGVEVRCLYRPWSFGTPDRVPVEADAFGNPAVRLLNIGAWGDAAAKFKWHTPAVADAHFCLQVECFHPADREPNNNLGQENTQVRAIASPLDLIIPLFNFRERGTEILITANEYAIADDEVRLPLRQIMGPRERPGGGSRPREEHGGEVRSVRPQDAEQDPYRGSRIRLSEKGRRGRRGVGYRVFGYEGFEQLAKGHDLRSFPLRDGWTLEVGGAVQHDGGWRLEMPPKTQQDVAVRIQVPDDAPAGEKAINVWATDRLGALLGGVTVYLRKEA